eukprot:7529278-Alexandrium_andersonii.AAC.1
MAVTDVTMGGRVRVSMISHGSGKLPRVARSSLATDVQGRSRIEDEVFTARGLRAELRGLADGL